MLPLRMKSWVGLGLLGVGAILCGRSFPGTEPEGAALRPGVPYELRAGKEHAWPLDLTPGEIVDARIEQRGIDVALTLADPGGEVLLALDSPTGSDGVERLVAVAETAGLHDLRVQGGEGEGSYVLHLGEPRPAGPRDRRRAQAFQEYSRGEALRRGGTDLRRALAHYDQAFRLWQDLGDADQAIIAVQRRGRLLQELGEPAAAVEVYQQALPRTGDPRDRVFLLNLLTQIHTRQGDARQALRTGEEALALAESLDDPVAHASALSNLGTLHRNLGENAEALKRFAASLEKWKEVAPQEAQSQRQRAKTLSNLAEAYLAIGSPRPALAPLEEALAVQRQRGDLGGEAHTLRILGGAYQQLGSRPVALHHLEQARQRAREGRNRWIEAMALSDTGSIQLEMGRIEEARRAFSEARQIARDAGSQDNEAFALAGLGRVQTAEGNAAGAIESFARSEELYTRLGDPNALSTVLYGRALAERSLGRIEESLGSIGRALDLVESLREDVTQSDLRVHVIGARADLYELQVDLLLRLHERQSDRGYDAQAFAASEWSRARSLLETVRKMGAGLPRNLPPEALRRQGELRGRLQQLARQKLRSAPRDLPRITAEISRTMARWEELSDEIRRQSPAYAAVTEPRLVGLRDVQALLDPDTALLAYTVGEERSILWWIEKNSLHVHQSLPPRAELEPLAAVAYDLLSRPSTKQRGRTQATLTRLGTILLGPVEDRLPRVRRLVVVADGALQNLPFAALTVPGSGAPLVDSHATVLLPSASLGAALRARQRQRMFSQLLAVFADPVFGPADPRFRGGRPAAGEPARLRHSGSEAAAILKLVSPEESRRFIGFDANRRTAMDPGLEGSRYIHFATHGLVDLENPSLSGIQLSRIDRQGRPVEGEGILPFYEVYNLRFPADLVTLSACRTAFGPQVRGEGTLGMSRSFLYAGASRVVGAFWDVDDAAAADLMVLFYQALLRDGKPPALALQDAQIRVREEWPEPHHWAGFVLQGDWR